MEILYFVCLGASLFMFFWLFITDVRKSVFQYLMFLALIISDLGYIALTRSANLTEAIVAYKILYVGGCFIPALNFLAVTEICHIKMSRWVVFSIIVTQALLYAVICTIGRNPLYYKTVEFYRENNMSNVLRTYGPFHVLYPITLYGYYILAVVVVIYSMIAKISISYRNLSIMLIFSGCAVSLYLIEHIFHLNYDIMPVSSLFLLGGTMLPLYQSNLYTVYQNEDVIKQQMDKIGFLTFNRKMKYYGCNTFMAEVFPELKNLRYGKDIPKVTEQNLQTIIDWIYEYKVEIKGVKVNHTDFKTCGTIQVDDSYYNSSIHPILDWRHICVGYIVELLDNTDHYKSVELTSRFNSKLSTDVEIKTKKIRNIQEKTILGMAQMVESRDTSTGGHIKRTSDVVRIFANKLKESDFGFEENFLNNVIRSAPMHDLGKIGVDDVILRKQDKYTESEYEVMKKHSEIGSRMVKEILTDVEEDDFVTVAQNVAHYHHEKVNGKGYPSGLKGNEIPVEARIMALADVFDALVSKRCYKEAFSYDQAFSIIKESAGSHFDKNLAEIFLTCRPELEEYYNKSIDLGGYNLTS